jgi:predicted AlkP superfamily pyrophosphatase or phosphodiesterase
MVQVNLIEIIFSVHDSWLSNMAFKSDFRDKGKRDWVGSMASGDSNSLPLMRTQHPYFTFHRKIKCLAKFRLHQVFSEIQYYILDSTN